MMDVNYFGAVELIRHIVLDMVRRNSGTVVMAASKQALQAFSDSLRGELAHTGVGVLVVSPGYVNTNLSRNLLKSLLRRRGWPDLAHIFGVKEE